MGYLDTVSQDGSLGTTSRFYEHVLSTIESPVFSRVSVIYLQSDFLAGSIMQHSAKHFELFRGMHQIRGFRLVLHADVREPLEGWVVQKLKDVVAAEKARGGFPEPAVTSAPRSLLRL